MKVSKNRLIYSHVYWPLLLIPVLTFTQGYLAMHHLRNQVSAACPDCTLEGDLLRYGLLLVLLMAGLTMVLRYLRLRRWPYVILSALFLMAGWAVIDNTIFDDRLASWSSFTTSALWIGSMRKSCVPILLMGTIWLGILFSSYQPAVPVSRD